MQALACVCIASTFALCPKGYAEIAVIGYSHRKPSMRVPTKLSVLKILVAKVLELVAA